MALLAATCSKIGTSAAAAADSGGGGGLEAVGVLSNQAPSQTSPIRLLTSGGQLVSVVGQPGVVYNQAGASATADVGVFEVASPLANSAGPVQIVANPASYAGLFGTQIMPISSQMIATPVAGPGGTITYNLIPQYQNLQAVTVGSDGQDHGIVDQRSVSQTQMIQSSIGLKQTKSLENVSSSAEAFGRTVGTGKMNSKNNINASSQVSTNFGGTISLANINQGGIITIGNGQQNIMTGRSNSNVQPIQQVQTVSVQIPVSAPNGQTILQSFQLPCQSVQPQQCTASGLTMYNIVPQQTIAVTPSTRGGTMQTSSAANITAGNSDSQPIVKVLTIPQQQAQPTLSALPSVLNVPTFGSDNSSVPVMMAIESQLLGNSNAGNQNTITVMAMPQSVIQPNIQSTAGAVQNILLSNGQIIQALTAPACPNFQNFQIIGQNNQGNLPTGLMSLNQVQLQVML